MFRFRTLLKRVQDRGEVDHMPRKRGRGLRNKAKQRGALGMLNLFFLEPNRLARIQFLTDIKRRFGQVTF